MKELDIWDLVKKAEETPAPVAEGHPLCGHVRCCKDECNVCCACGADLTKKETE